MKKKTFRSLLGFLLCLCLITSVGALAGSSIAKYVTDIKTSLKLTVDGKPAEYIVDFDYYGSNKNPTHFYFGSFEEYENELSDMTWEDGTPCQYNEADTGSALSGIKYFQNNNEGETVKVYFLNNNNTSGPIIINDNSNIKPDKSASTIYYKTLEYIDFEKVKLELENYAWLFAGFESLETVKFPETVDVRTTTAYMFQNCQSLETVNLDALHSSDIQHMSGMFQSCSKLTVIDLSGFTCNNNLQTFDAVFVGCSSLQTVYVHEDWKEPGEIVIEFASSPFLGCSNLKGGADTTFNEDNTSAKYARIDGGKSDPGYFTANAAANTLALAAPPAYTLPEGVREGEFQLYYGMPNMAELNGMAELAAGEGETFIGWLVEISGNYQQVPKDSIEQLINELYEAKPDYVVGLAPLYQTA